MNTKVFENLSIRSVNNYAKKFVEEKYKTEKYQIKVTRIMKNNHLVSIKEIERQNLFCHLNQIYLDKFSYVYFMIVFKEGIICCNIPSKYFKTIELCSQHSSKCFQASICLNTIIKNYKESYIS